MQIHARDKSCTFAITHRNAANAARVGPGLRAAQRKSPPPILASGESADRK